MVVSILIPAYDDLVGLETTLKSLADVEARQIEREIIICNDGGGDPVSMLAIRYNCLEARLEKNSGSYAARNAGLAIASGQYIAFVDADQRVDQLWIEVGITALENADYVGGRVVLEVGPNPDVWERYDQLNAFPVEFYLRVLKFAPTANLFVRRKVFEAVGPFQESLRSGGDGEFGRRVHLAGFVQRYAPDAITFHDARNRRQQLRKLRRVGCGVAEIRLKIYGENPFEVIFSSFDELIREFFSIFRMMIKHFFKSTESMKSDEFYFRLIGRFHAGMFAFWKLVWAIKWLKKNN